MVKLAPALPKENERNGIEARTRDLIRNYDSGQTIPVIMLVRTQEVTRNKDYETVPKVEVVHIEAVPDDRADEVRQLLVDLHDARLTHVKQPLDLPDTEDDSERLKLADPLAIEAADEVIYAEVVDDESPRALTGSAV